jgi:hypothetical protein
MKPVYIVQNDHCGIIGVFGTIKSAYEFASKRQNELYDVMDVCHDLDVSYAKVCGVLRGTVNFPAYLDYDAETSITCFELNRTDYTPAYMEED